MEIRWTTLPTDRPPVIHNASARQRVRIYILNTTAQSRLVAVTDEVIDVLGQYLIGCSALTGTNRRAEKPTAEGLNCTHTGPDGSPECKDVLMPYVQRGNSPDYLVEGSGAVEKSAPRIGIPITPNREAGRIPSRSNNPNTDCGHYERHITISGLLEMHTKIIFRIPCSLKNTEKQTSLPISSTSTSMPAGQQTPHPENTTSSSNPFATTFPGKNALTDAQPTRRSSAEDSSAEADRSPGGPSRRSGSPLASRGTADADNQLPSSQVDRE